MAPLAALFAMTATPTSAAPRSQAILILDANSGRVISENEADQSRYPASLTKMMTLYIVFDLIEQGRLSYDTRIRFSDAAVSVQPTKLGVSEGTSLPLINVVKALIVKSANDAAVAVAEHIAGSEAKFAALMTQKAHQIGMNRTTFKNAHGLPNSEQTTTARDMATLGLRLQDDFPTHYALFSTREIRQNGDTHRNHNTMLWSYEGTDGIKTGYTGASGFNLVANVRRSGKHVLGVVIGGSSAASRNQTMRTLLNLALFKASSTKTRQPTVAVRAKGGTKIAQQPAIDRGGAAPLPTPQLARRQVIALAPAEATAVTDITNGASAPPARDVDIARVKPVLVAPRTRATPAQPTLQAPNEQAATLRPTLLASNQETRPSPAATFASAGNRLGAQPSTLQQQADALARNTGPTAQVAGPSSGGTALIQVGAFSTQLEAERQLLLVREKAKDVLSGYPGVATPAQSNGRSVFRARFSGVDLTKAGSICNELRRRQVDCLVARAD